MGIGNLPQTGLVSHWLKKLFHSWQIRGSLWDIVYSILCFVKKVWKNDFIILTILSVPTRQVEIPSELLMRSQQSALSRNIFSKRSISPRVTKVKVCPTSKGQSTTLQRYNERSRPNLLSSLSIRVTIGLAGSCCSPDSMDVGLDVRRRTVIHHSSDLGDVDTPGHDIRTSKLVQQVTQGGIKAKQKSSTLELKLNTL